MTNTSFNKISELMMPERTAESRATKSAGADQASSEAAGQRFDQLLRTATSERPREATQPETRRADRQAENRSNDRDRPARRDRSDRPDRFEKPARADRQSEVDRRRPDDRPENTDQRSTSEDRVSTDDRSDDRVRPGDDERATADDATSAEDSDSTEMTDDATDGEATDEATTDADAGTADTDAAATQDTSAADAMLAEMSTDESADADVVVDADADPDATSETGPAMEITEIDGGMATEMLDTEAVEMETEQAAETDESAEVVDLTEAVEAGEADRESAAENNAAAAQAAATPVVANAEQSEAVTEETVEIAVDSSAQAGAAAEGAAEEVEGLVAQTESGGTSDAEAGDPAEEVTDGADDGELADQSNADGEQNQQDQSGEQQAEGAETTDAPLVAGPQVANVQGTAQAGTSTNAVTGVGPVTGTGEVGPTTANQVAGTAPAEQADGADPLWRQVRRAMGSIRNLPTGEQQLTIRLRPDDLGSVVVRISTGEAGTTVALVAESAVAANQLTQQRQQLIRELEDGGLRGVAVDVGTSDNTQQGDGDGDETEMSQTAGTIGGTTADGADGDPVRAYGERRAGRSTEGLIDVDL